MKKTHRIISLVLVLCLMLCYVPMRAVAVTGDFQGMVISYDAGVTVKFYSGWDDTTLIDPSQKENYTQYYPNLPSGKYRVVASRSGYITLSENIYISPTEATTRMEKHYSLVKRDNAWDPSYARKLSDEALAAMPSDPTLWPEYAAAFTTPVFTTGRAMHKFTTQTEMENFIAGLDGDNDKMYVYSLGTTQDTIKFDIPLVIFTETDLSRAKTLEEAAALLEENGKVTVHYQAQIHGNEPAAGEAALGMIAMLDNDYGDALLDRMNVYVIPRLNPDGAYQNKRVIPAVSVDPNRDYTNLESYEVSRTIHAMNLFNPEVFVDGHEFTVLLESSSIVYTDMKINSGRSIYATEEMVTHADNLSAALFANMEANNMTYGWYHDYVTGWNSAVGTSYTMQRGMLSFLLESYGIHGGTFNMARRTASHIAALDGLFQYLYENHEEVHEAVNEQREILIQDGKTYGDGDLVALETADVVSPAHDILNAKKLDLATGAITATTVKNNKLVYAVRSRENPTAYLVPADHEKIDEVLQKVSAHDLSYYQIPAGAYVTAQHVGGDTTQAAIFAAEPTYFPNGAYVFKMDQPNARILALLMEPDTTINVDYNSSFAQAGVFTLTDGEYPVYRYVRNLNADDEIDYSFEPEAIEDVSATVYVDQTNGSDNNDGRSESAAVASLDKAYAQMLSQVSGNGTGTVVFLSEYKLTTKVNTFASHNFPVILTSKTGAEGINYTYTPSSGSTNGEINLNGPTTFRKITISNNGKDNYTYITAGGHKLVMDADVVTAGAKMFMLVGGRKESASTNADMTVRGGTYSVIYLATYKGSHNGPVNFTMTGGKANSYITPSYSGTVTGDITIKAENCNMGGTYLGNTSKNNVTGDITVTLGKSVTFTSFYAGSRDAGNVNGTVTVIADGIDLSTYTIYGKAKNSTGTIDHLKLVLKQGELADVAANFVTRDGVDVILGCDQTKSAKLNYSCNLDLNGCDANITMATGKTLTVWDSATDDYMVMDTQGYGVLSATGTVVVRDGYKVRTEIGGNSYHRWDFALDKVTLRTSNAGIYYVGQFGLNELFRTEVESYGVVLSTNAKPALGKENCLYTSMADWPAGGKGNGSILSNIMDTDNNDSINAANAEQKVYGVAYIKYKDGTVDYSNQVCITLKTLVECIDVSWNSLTQAQKDGACGMYEQFSTVMKDWNIPNIKAAA